MFSVYCTTHGGPVLLGSRSIERLTNTPDGIELAWRCTCGTRGTLVTGASARHDEHHDHEAPAAA